MQQRPSLKRLLIISAFTLILLWAGIQFIRPAVTNPEITGDFQAPREVKAIIRKACYDCHSNETQLRWYDKIAPFSWRVASHIKSGRAVLNFSEWDKLAASDQKGRLWEAVNQIMLKAMPLRDYEMVHPSARVSAAGLAVLKKYVGSMTADIPPATARQAASAGREKKSEASGKDATQLPVALNGITYIPDYKEWQVISTTERFDNGTMRVIFGNEIAVKAIKENTIRPWPNGTIFAKAAWKMTKDKDGNIRPGAFWQIEYMIKDDKKYASAAGWGWARFKSPQLTPYGKDVAFVNECINCHRPVSKEDFVFTLPIKH